MPIDMIIRSNLFPDDSEQPVRVRDGLTVEKLLADIRREYRQLPDGNYILRLKDSEQPLASEITLEEAGVRPGAELIYELGQTNLPSIHTTPALTKRVMLQAETGQRFFIVRNPALIGRPHPEKRITPDMLDVDLTDLDTSDRKTVSRPHARITESDGVYSIHSLRVDNPVYVNDRAVETSTPQILKSGDHLRFGKVNLVFKIENQQATI